MEWDPPVKVIDALMPDLKDNVKMSEEEHSTSEDD